MGHVIRNFDELATTDLRTDALAIAEAAYCAIDVGAALRRTVRVENDTLFVSGAAIPLVQRRVYFVGVGKCAFAVAREIESLLGDLLTAGIALDVSQHTGNDLKKIETHVCTHPLPSDTNARASARIVEFLTGRREDDLVIMLLSGGGSTLLCLPEAPMTPELESELFRALTARGAPIQDINTVRKHLSRVRGGGLAAAAYPAEVVALIASDVPGNDIHTIASGPTLRDESTVYDAATVLAKYGIAKTEEITFLETPKESMYFDRVTNTLFLSSQDATRAMKTEAEKRGYTATVIDEQFVGDTHTIGRAAVEKLHAAPSKTAHIYAGESTLKLPANSLGAGGRNLEMALAVLENVPENELVLPFASDGHDNTEFAGAIADGVTRSHSHEHSLSIQDHLDAHTSYEFFKTSLDALLTGYTGSNVSDLIIALKK